MDSNDTPRPINLGGGSAAVSHIFVAGLNDRCQVQTVAVSMHAHRTPSVPATMTVYLSYESGADIRRGDMFQFPSPDAPPLLSGPNLGTQCGSLTFRDGAPPFSSARPPFDGTFRPYDVAARQPDSFGPAFRGHRANGDWGLFIGFNDGGSPLQLDCWQLRLTLALAP